MLKCFSFSSYDLKCSRPIRSLEKILKNESLIDVLEIWQKCLAGFQIFRVFQVFMLVGQYVSMSVSLSMLVLVCAFQSVRFKSVRFKSVRFSQSFSSCQQLVSQSVCQFISEVEFLHLARYSQAGESNHSYSCKKRMFRKNLVLEIRRKVGRAVVIIGSKTFSIISRIWIIRF